MLSRLLDLFQAVRTNHKPFGQVFASATLAFAVGLPWAVHGQQSSDTQDASVQADSDEGMRTSEEFVAFLREMGIDFKLGPMTGDLGNAEIKIDSSWAFLDKRDSAKLMEIYGNRETGMERGLIAPADAPDSWFAIFEFDNIGYIENAADEEIDADALMDSFKSGDKPQNEWREQNGLEAMHTLGWQTEPHYDPATNNLEWCIKLRVGDTINLNHNIRLLGRRGVMSVTLVCDAEQLDSALSDVHRALDGFTYKTGNSYAEYQSGDKIAQYGLAALVGGGAVALAAKSGFLQKLIKPLIIGVVVFFGVIAKFFRQIFGGFAKE